jgi:hypothetical protein
MDKRHALADGFSGDEIEVLVARNKRGRAGRCVLPGCSDRRPHRTRHALERPGRQRNEQRRTELTRRGNRVITFTHQDLRDRLASIASQLVAAVRMSSAA